CWDLLTRKKKTAGCTTDQGTPQFALLNRYRDHLTPLLKYTRFVCYEMSGLILFSVLVHFES
ncbi:MAG TPA: hypothetical protein P5307_13220, partial [Pirellulaceae bacterium]|nr:hypothetical protein [Pirellulaceae bacterium]